MSSRNNGRIFVGIGGWTFEPWRGVFYPDDLTQKRELEYASRKLTSIEINGTYYSTFKPDSWRKWREETPDDFVFTLSKEEYLTLRPKSTLVLPEMLKGLGDVKVEPSPETRAELLKTVNESGKRKGMPKGGWPKKDA